MKSVMIMGLVIGGSLSGMNEPSLLIKEESDSSITYIDISALAAYTRYKNGARPDIAINLETEPLSWGARVKRALQDHYYGGNSPYTNILHNEVFLRAYGCQKVITIYSEQESPFEAAQNAYNAQRHCHEYKEITWPPLNRLVSQNIFIGP